MAAHLFGRLLDTGQNRRFHQRRHGIGGGPIGAEISRFARDADGLFKGGVIGLHLVVGERIVLQLVVRAQLVLAVALFGHGFDLKIIRRKTINHAVPVRARPAQAVAQQKGAEAAHGQRPHVFRITKRNGFFGEILHKPVLNGVAPLVVNFLEILQAPTLAALQAHHGQTGFGAFGQHDASGKSHAHGHHIHFFQHIGHIVGSPR